MLTPPSHSDHPNRLFERDALRLPRPLPSALIPASATMAEGVTILRAAPSLAAVEVVKRPLQSAIVLGAYVSDCTEFSLLYQGRDSVAFRAYFDKNLRTYGFPREICSDLTGHISRLFEDFRDATQSESVEAYLILRRPRARSHWHIDHYRANALQFVTTLAGYPNTPFLLSHDYDRAEFERYRLKMSERQTEIQKLSCDDPLLYSLKTEMNRLGDGKIPRFVSGDLLFNGEELFHASPRSPVSRLIFAMSTSCSDGNEQSSRI